MKQYKTSIIGFTTFLLLCVVVTYTTKGQDLSTQWGGRGSINIETPVVAPNGAVRLQYSIIGSRGTAAGVQCVVVSPSGNTIVNHQSFSMPNGSGSTTFQFPAGSERGGYLVFCYWYIKGYGVDGPTCLAYGIFKVK